MKVTFDANMFPCDELINLCNKLGLEVYCATTTNREFNNTSFEKQLEDTNASSELCLVNMSSINASRVNSSESSERLNEILRIISDGAYPKSGQAKSRGERKQLNDALTFEAHLNEKSDIFVTNDQKAFIKFGKREKLQEKFNTKIMTENEFRKWIKNIPV